MVTAQAGTAGRRQPVKGTRTTNRFSFSLWDFKTAGIGSPGWLPALPVTVNSSETNRSVINDGKCKHLAPGQACCKRNCQDCAVHSGPTANDGSTGTQCKVFIPAYSGQKLRVRIQRVLEAQTAEAYGKLWTGDVWEVSISDLSTGAMGSRPAAFGIDFHRHFQKLHLSLSI